MGMLIGPVGGPNFGPSASSSATPNSAWNCGRWFPVYLDLMI